MSETKPEVEFWFDPICPWTWITSRWAAEVAQAREFEIVWRPFSLKVLNEGRESASHAEGHNQGHRMGRVIVAARQLYGDEVVGKLYAGLGRRIHNDGRSDYDAIITEALGEAELSGQTDLAADETAFDAELAQSTRAGIDRVGPGVGIPLISIDGTSFFGPVVSPAPQGDEALKLWDGIYAAASVPGFFELKRGREVGPIF